jgi:hypothetical protein
MLWQGISVVVIAVSPFRKAGLKGISRFNAKVVRSLSY